MKPEVWNSLFKRGFITLALATVIIFIISEGVYFLRKDKISREPQVIQLTIPPGTAAQVDKGESVTNIPQRMIFVTGDTLLVYNADDVAHELGPLWIPPGKNASLKLDLASDFSYSCSFTPSKYLGLTVKEATTWKTRLVALFYGVPPLWMFFLVYSFVLVPMKSDESDPQAVAAGKDFQPEWGWRQFEDEQDPPRHNT